MKTSTILFTIFGFVLLMNLCSRMVGNSCVGKKISVNLDSINIEKRFTFPEGEFLFANLEDSLPPIMIKLNEEKEIQWAVILEETQECIRMNSVSSLKYSEDKKRFDFFNSTYMEPGYIQLDWDYDIDYVYTSPM